MSTMNAFRYTADVDNLLREVHISLRAHALAFDTPLECALPIHMRQQDADAKAEQLARQLMFSVLSVTQGRLPDAQRIWEWIVGITSFLFSCLMKKEQTFVFFLKVYDLTREIRSELFKDRLPLNAPLRADKTPPLSRDIMELAIVHMLLATGQLDPHQRFEPLFLLK